MTENGGMGNGENGEEKEYIKRWGRLLNEEFDVDEMSCTLKESESFENFISDSRNSTLDEWGDRFSLVYNCIQHGREDILYYLLDVSIHPFTAHLGERMWQFEEWDRIEPIMQEISELSNEQFNKTFVDVWGFRSTERGISVSQSQVYLMRELMEGHEKLEVTDTTTAHLGIDIYRKIMDICDSSVHNLLSVKRASNGSDPNEVDLESLSFSASLNELDEYPFSNAVDGIDQDFRNGISHGDMIVDGFDNQVSIAGGKTFSFEEFGDIINTGLAISEILSNLDFLLICEKIYRIKGVSGVLYQAMYPYELWDQ